MSIIKVITTTLRMLVTLTLIALMWSGYQTAVYALITLLAIGIEVLSYLVVYRLEYVGEVAVAVGAVVTKAIETERESRNQAAEAENN